MLKTLCTDTSLATEANIHMDQVRHNRQDGPPVNGSILAFLNNMEHLILELREAGQQYMIPETLIVEYVSQGMNHSLFQSILQELENAVGY